MTFEETLLQILTRLAVAEGWPGLIPDDYLVADTETLGFCSTSCRIVQIGFCLVEGGKLSKTLWSSGPYLAQTIKWPKEDFEGKEDAIKVHGIDYDRAQREGHEPKEVMRLVADILDWAGRKGYMLVGHNAHRFDIPFLMVELARTVGVNFKAKQDRLLDTGLLVKAAQLDMLPGQGERALDYYNRVSAYRASVKWSLDKFCVPAFQLEKRGIDTSKSHDAGYDCFVTHSVLEHLKSLFF